MSSIITKKTLAKLPVNLRKQAIREARNRNESLSKRKSRKRKRRDRDPDRLELDEYVAVTQNKLREILADCELSDINCDATPEELLGEIALAEGYATTIYVERDGLSTLTIILHQENPTIANLKHAIAQISRTQHKREQRERYEERLQRRRINMRTNDTNTEDDNELSKNLTQQQFDSTMRFTGELVCSTTHNGHKHRSNVSWRFLWRAYALYNVDTQQPVNDENGRALLTDLGIENASTLKFCHRVKYFGRKRQT